MQSLETKWNEGHSCSRLTLETATWNIKTKTISNFYPCFWGFCVNLYSPWWRLEQVTLQTQMLKLYNIPLPSSNAKALHPLPRPLWGDFYLPLQCLPTTLLPKLLPSSALSPQSTKSGLFKPLRLVICDTLLLWYWLEAGNFAIIRINNWYFTVLPEFFGCCVLYCHIPSVSLTSLTWDEIQDNCAPNTSVWSKFKVR